MRSELQETIYKMTKLKVQRISHTLVFLSPDSRYVYSIHGKAQDIEETILIALIAEIQSVAK